MKNTTACTQAASGASWRKRRSSSVNVGVAPGWLRRFTISLSDAATIEPAERAPRLSQPSRTQSLSSEGPTPRLEVRRLHLFPQPVDDVVDLEFQHQLNFALIAAALPFFAAALAVRALKHIAWLGAALTSTLLFLRLRSR